jgi:hypothetical protein
MDDLKIVRKRLAARKRAIDLDVPNHAFESALALSAQATGLEDAIHLIDKVRAERKAKGRVFNLDSVPKA